MGVARGRRACAGLPYASWEATGEFNDAFRKESKVKRSILLTAVICAVLVFGCSRTDRKDLVLAEVDTRTITIADFETTAETLENKYLPETNDLEGKKELLQHMVNKEIMALKAIAMGYERDEEFAAFWKQFKGPFLITALWNEEISKKVTVTEEEIDAYFEEMHYEYTLSQIVAASEEQANQIRDEVLAGADFAEMAKKYSLGKAADNGGYIGSSPVGKIHWWIEEVLFEMESGDITPAVKTDVGYAILKVHKKRKIIPEEERDYAVRRVRAIKEYKGRNELKARIERDIHLQFYSDAVNIIFDLLPEDVPFEEIINYRVTRANAPELVVPEQYRDMILCQYDDGIYTIADFVELYHMSSLIERPRHQYGRESILQLMKKVIFDKVLPVYAEEVVKVLEIPEVAKNLGRRREQFLVYKLYQEQIDDEVAVTTKEIADYYEANKTAMETKEQRNYAIILVDDKKVAMQVAGLAKGGEDFGKLALKFSQDPTAKDNKGETGLIYPGNYMEYDDVGFGLPNEGDVSDPFPVSRGWAVVKVLEIVPGRMPTMEEAKSSIRKELKEKKGEALLEEKLESWKEGYVIKIHENNLKKAEMNRTRI